MVTDFGRSIDTGKWARYGTMIGRSAVNRGPSCCGCESSGDEPAVLTPSASRPALLPHRPVVRRRRVQIRFGGLCAPEECSEVAALFQRVERENLHEHDTATSAGQLSQHASRARTQPRRNFDGHQRPQRCSHSPLPPLQAAAIGASAVPAATRRRIFAHRFSYFAGPMACGAIFVGLTCRLR
jgi:hypothetical protein